MHFGRELVGVKCGLGLRVRLASFNEMGVIIELSTHGLENIDSPFSF